MSELPEVDPTLHLLAPVVYVHASQERECGSGTIKEV
jgi:hypothetical protein